MYVVREKEMKGVTEMAKRTVSKCEKCGKRKSKYANTCNSCDKARRAKLYAENQAVVDTGKCPDCGSGLHRNLSLAGWWQCDRFGSEGFQKDPGPKCDFQVFTEF